MTVMYLNEDNRTPDYWLAEDMSSPGTVEVDLSDEFITRYEEAVMNYDGIQAELELIYKSKSL